MVTTRRSQEQRQQRRDEIAAAFMEEFGHAQPGEGPEPDVLNDEAAASTASVAQQEGGGEGSNGAATAAAAETSVANTGGNRRTSNGPNRRLVQIREGFNAAGVRKKSKAKSTFDGHQRNNERFILYLFENHPQFLKDDLCHELHDADAEPDYSSVEATYHVYRRRGGKKSLDERKRDYREMLLRRIISNFLGKPGTTPPQLVVDFTALTSNAETFADYLTSMRKDDGGIHKAGNYLSHRSSLGFLFRRYKFTPSREFDADLKEYVEGIKRTATEARQAGEGNIWDGNRALTWPLYEQFNRWFLKMGTTRGIFACAFSKTCMGLACRGINTAQICFKHVKWLGDAMSIPFAHSKDSQNESNKLKKLARSLHVNPLKHDSDIGSALFDYLALNPEELRNPEGALFSGSQDHALFRQIVKEIKTKYKTIIEVDFGFDIDDIGPHSWRKGAHTRLNTGSTAGPSGAAACIRGGHTLGGSKDIYIFQERDTDGMCSRLTAGLNINSPEFAVSYPKFLGVDSERSLQIGQLSDAEIAEKQKEVDELVHTALSSIFGEATLERCSSFVPILRVGLASHLIHRDSYDGLFKEGHPDLGKLLPDESALRATPLFTNPIMNQLRKWIHIAMPWQDHYEKYFQKATGIPPHVVITAYIKGMQEDISGLQDAVSQVPQRLEELLDRRQMAGPLSLEAIVNAVQNGPMMTGLASDVAALRQIFTDDNVNLRDLRHNSSGRNRPRHNMRLYREYRHADGQDRRVPHTWVFPNLHLQNMYVYWHCGDEEGHIPPMKVMDYNDVKFIQRGRKKLSEIGRVMKFIDAAATSAGSTPTDTMTHVEANAAYNSAQPAISQIVPSETPTGRRREKVRKLMVGTVYKWVCKHEKSRP